MKKILIANRGEIAIRIAKTAKKMGIKTVGIKGNIEPTALYLSYVDEIYDNSEKVTSIPVFLDVDRLIEIAKETGAEAIHPGYGFLSENPYFAQKCANQNIIFIGPSPDAIYKMGNKTIARRIAHQNNIPMVDGSKGAVGSVEEANRVVSRIGLPIIIKAASGGGGRGMRIVRDLQDLEKSFQIASNEALKAFNDPTVFIEKYIENPKHIEFQILGDTFGNIVHLGERECSIQRKNQKLLEEAPSAAVDNELREKMSAVAIQIAKAVNYYSVGTVEFLLDSNKNFYFMEMNTRIQVEHPVTEAITGIDLIEQQINVANGKAIPFKQEDITLKGAAIECRINSEDVQNGFIPSTGRIENLVFPTDENIRVDSGIKEGSTISTGFDSMIAKLIVKGPTRDETIKKCLEVLDDVCITGVKTTIPFFKVLLNNENFLSGNFTTSFVEKDLDKYFLSSETDEIIAAWLATKSFYEENLSDNDVNFDQGKELSPWLQNRRSKQFDF